MFHDIFCKYGLYTITWSLLAGNVSHLQFLLGQEKQLTGLEASILQNSVQISQLLKSDYFLTFWVDTLSSCKIQLQPSPCSKQQITTALQQALTAADLLYLRQNLGEIHSSHSCMSAFVAT